MFKNDYGSQLSTASLPLQKEGIRSSEELRNMQDDILEALDGLQWQYEKKNAELESLRNQLLGLPENRTNIQNSDIASDVSRSLLRITEVILRPTIAELQQQVGYLAGRIERTRSQLALLRTMRPGNSL